MPPARRRVPPAFLVLVLSLFAARYAWAAPPPSPDAEAVEVAARTIAEITAQRGASPLDLPDLEGARPGRAYAVHDPRDGKVAYRLVPLLESGRVVAMVGVDAAGERRLWIGYGETGDSFPALSAAEARVRAADRARSLAADRPAGGGRLTEGTDGRLYWRFETARGGCWLVDADRPAAAVRGSADGSARETLGAPFDPRRGRAAERPAAAPPGTGGDGSDETRALPDAYVIPGIPYHHQITSWYCGPAALQMIMDYHGEEIGQDPIADVANDVVGSGCYSDDMVRAAHFSGRSAAVQDSTLVGYAERKLGYACPEFNIGGYPNPYAATKRRIHANEPLFALTWYGSTHSAGHYRVICGWDDNLDVFLVHDPWYGPPYSGPYVLFDQTFFLGDLWDYTYQWTMVPAPWSLSADLPSVATAGETLTVELEVLYPGSGPLTGKNPCTGCAAEILLPAGFTLASGTAVLPLADMYTGDADTVSWEVVAGGAPGAQDLRFAAWGIVSAYCQSYGSYQDSIGGRHLETVEVEPARLDGWDEEARLSFEAASAATGFPAGRAVAVENDGTVHAVWSDTRDGNAEIYHRVRSGGIWQTETRLTVDSAFSGDPAIAVDEAGRVHVAWVDTRDGEREIYYKTKDNAGWSADQRVTSFAGADVFPSLAAGGGEVFLAWQRNLAGLTVYTVHFSALGDTGWSAPIEPDNSSVKDSYRPCLARGTDGLLHLIYEREGGAPEHEKIRHRSWDGAAWSSATVLTTDLAPSRRPVIAAGPSGTLHAAWQEYENGGGDILYARFDGSAWSAAESVAVGPDEAGVPAIAAGGDGRVHVAWVDHRHSRSEIYARRRETDGSWSEEMRLSDGPDISALPSLAANDCGYVCAVWTDYRHEEPEVYFRGASVETGVELAAPTPDRSRGPSILSAPRPAPFLSETRLLFTLDAPGRAFLAVYDLSGRRVRVLADGAFPAGAHVASWDGRLGSGRKAAPGVYFVRCLTPRGADSRRVVLLR